MSGALTLLTNIAMARNTRAIQTVIETSPAGSLAEPHLTHIAPVAHRHINTNGRIRFEIEEYGRLAHAGGRKNRNGR
ncbi:MAG: Tn3 family transposase [Alphaproteobacteria bacterium]|nr:Tn3 family transposase [Alphaproteobacteria bacterium]